MKKIKVFTHKGYFEKRGEPYLFITVRNITDKDIWIEHIWLSKKLDATISVYNPERPTPFRLKAGNSWETWVSEKDIIYFPVDEMYSHVYVCARTVHSSKAYSVQSEKDQHVAPSGIPPDGTW